MKKHLPFLAVTTALLCQSAGARVIYGKDNRVEVFEATKAQQIKAQAAATMISNSSISLPNKKGLVKISQGTLREYMERKIQNDSAPEPRTSRPDNLIARLFAKKEKKITFCKGERFVDQPNPGICSGFLIAPDLIVTAGHCVNDESMCKNYKWAFGFELDERTQKAGVNFDSKKLYSCKKIISNSLIDPLKTDFGLVQLDRPVEGVTPLEIRTSGKVRENTELFVIGSPSGLPLKVADGAQVRANKHPLYFTANLDTFQGNSGSAVFNDETGKVEGILVRGDDDYVANLAGMCVEAKRCTNGGCRGESVSKITSLPEIGVYETIDQAIEYGDLQILKNVFKLNVWVDFYLANGETALIKAARANAPEIVKFLLQKGASKKHKDVSGKTALDHALENNSQNVLTLLAD